MNTTCRRITLLVALSAAGCQSSSRGAATPSPDPSGGDDTGDGAPADSGWRDARVPDATERDTGAVAAKDAGKGDADTDARTDAGGGLDASGSCEMEFSDLRAQVPEFIGYNTSILLTPQQEAVKRAALEAIPAPCCSDNTAYTCCCPCNMAKTIWGLSHFLIARKGCTAPDVIAAVRRWVAFINPLGFTGDSCYTGGCERAFRRNGCGGMDETKIIYE